MLKRVAYLTCLIGVFTADLTAAQERRYTLLERELEYLMEVWPGNYDNREQVQHDADIGRPDYESGAHLRVHGQISRVELPAFGPYVLYVEEYKDDDPSSVFRQRLYELSADESESAVRVRLHFFKNGEKYLGAHDDPSILKDLTPDDTETVDGCDIFLRRDSYTLAGGMKQNACAFGEDDERRYSDYQLRIGEYEYGFRDRMVSAATGDTLDAVAGFQWHDLRQARWFMCMIDFPVNPENPSDPRQYTGHYVRIHDQGGTFSFIHPDGRSMTLSMRTRWSYGMQRDSFVIKIHDGGEPDPDLVYHWGQPGDDRIGMNPGWIRVQCDLDTQMNRDLQQRLRPDS